MTASQTFTSLAPEKQSRVLDAALDEFAEHGYHQASVNRLVKKLGIAKGSLFKYFGAKEGLFEYIFQQGIEQIKAPLRAAREQSVGQDLFSRVRASLLAGVAFVETHPRVYRMYLKLLFQENIPFRERLLGEVRLYSAKYLRSLVDDAVARGEVHGDVSPEMAVFYLDCLMDRFLQAQAAPYMDSGAGLYGADAAELEHRIDELIALMRRGLAISSLNQT